MTHPKITDIEISSGGVPLPFSSWIFPGGEVGFKLDAAATNELHIAEKLCNHSYRIWAPIKNSNDLMILAQAQEAIRSKDQFAHIHLVMPYVPYARQDRACDAGEAFSLKVFMGIINSLCFNFITIVDPHSEVTPALIDCPGSVRSQLDIIRAWPAFLERFAKKDAVVLVSPDAGANKKTSTLASFFSHKEFIRADKLRDLSNGNIKETIVYADDLYGATALIADDICDGGRTFIELAKVLKAKNAGKVVLFVTHGIFSKGFEPLFSGGIDEVWTTTSLFNASSLHSGEIPEPYKSNIHAFDLKTLFYFEKP